MPTSHLAMHRLESLAANSRQEVRMDTPLLVYTSPRAKVIAKKLETYRPVLTLPIGILAVDDPRLLGVNL